MTLPTAAKFRLLVSDDGTLTLLVLWSFHSGCSYSIAFFASQSGTSKKWLNGTTVAMAVAPSGINLLRFMISKILRIENNTNRTMTNTSRTLYSFFNCKYSSWVIESISSFSYIMNS